MGAANRNRPTCSIPPTAAIGVLAFAALVALPHAALRAAPGGNAPAIPVTQPKSAPSPSTAKRDWSDLEDNEFKLFGSDKEEKIPLSLKPIAEIEDWRDPKTKERYLSYKMGWLLYWTINVNRYPKFDRTRFLLYSNLESKIDNRRQTWFFPLYHFERDGDEETTITPLTYHFFSNREEIGLIGPFYNYRTRDETRRFLLPLVFYGENRAEQSNYLGLFPLFWHSAQKDKDRETSTLLTPLFYHTSDQPTQGESSSFSVSPLHFYNSERSKKTLGLPAVPLLFFRHEDTEKQSVHYNMGLIFDALWEKSTLERLWAFPLLFYQRGDRGYLHVAPPLYVSFQEPGFSYTHLLPLYFNLIRDKREIEATPISFYSKEETSEGTTHIHRNFLWLFDWATDSKDGLRRFAFIPFFFYSPGPERYLHVLPPLYVSFGEKDWSYRHLFPLAFQWRHGPEEIDFYWLYSRSTDGRIDHHNFLGLVDLAFDRTKTTGSLRRLWTVPFLFYEPDSYLHVLPPLYVSLKWEDSGYRHVFPFFFNGWDRDGSFLFAWLYSRSTDRSGTVHNVAGLLNLWKDSQGRTQDLWLLPLYFQGENYRHVAPFYFSYEDKTSSTAFGPGYYYASERGSEKSTSLLLGPLWVHRKPAEERTDVHLLPLSYFWLSKREFTYFLLPTLTYIRSEQKGNTAESRMHWPLWSYERDVTKNEQTTTDSLGLFAWLYYGERYSYKQGDTETAFSGLDVSPLYVYRRSHARGKETSTKSYSVWFPIVPMFYRSYSREEGTHTNLLYLADWKSDARGNLERFWFLPLAFYGRSEYLHIFPFFLRPFGSDAEEGWSGGPLHYHSWSKEHNRLWLGLYYGAKDKSDKSATTVLFPLYYSWQRQDSSGSVFLPFRVHYEDRQKYVSVWFFGGSSSQQSGALTANLGQSERGLWYVDVDYSFFYNLFSFAYRKSIFAPAESAETGPGHVTKTADGAPAKDGPKTAAKTGAKTAAKTDPKGEPVAKGETRIAEGDTEGGVRVVGGGPPLRYFDRVKLDEQNAARRKAEREQPKLTRSPEITRETARDFWGISALFGMFAYQEADTERHVRFFPLAWLTWDVRYDNKVTALPFYFQYERDELSYTVLFPLYAHQRVAKSHISAYGLLLFMKEYDDEIKEQSYSILWPVLHKYDSPTRDGFRIFPLLWHRNIHEKDEAGALVRKGSHTVVAPLLYHTSESVKTEQGWEHSAFRINPLEFYRSSADSRNESELAWRPLIPLYVSRTTGFSVSAADSPTREVERSGWSLFVPLALTRTREVVRKDKQTDRETLVGSEFQLFGLPFLYYGTERTQAPESKSSSFFLLGYYDHERKGYSEQSVLFGLFRRTRSSEPFEKTTSFLYGLVRSSDRPGGATTWLLPLYYNSYDRTETEESSLTAVPILLSVYSKTTRRTETGRYRSTSFYSPLYMNWSTFDSDRKEDSSTTLFPLLPLPLLYRSSSANGQAEWDWLKIFHWERASTGQVSWRLFPLLFYESGDEGSFTVFPLFWSYRNTAQKEHAVHVIPPLFMSWRRPNEWSMFVGGLYLESSPESSRANFLYLIDHRSDKKADEYVFGMLFDFFRIRGGTKRRFELDVGFGLLFGLDVEGEKRYDWNFLWMQNERRPGRFESSFIPFWWFESRTHEPSTRAGKTLAGGTEWNLWLLPLTYISVDTRANRGDTYFLLGGMYFRNESNYSRQNLYFLFDHYKYETGNREFWGLLFHSFSYERRGDRTKLGLAYRLLGGMDYKSPTDYDFNVLWYVQYQDGPQFHSSFLPLWYYASDANSSVLVVPPLLAYSSRDRGGVFELVGLGTLWYRNYDAATLDDSRRVLLGAVFEQQSRAANGFSSVGSVWGFLWQYQSETETGFQKFSVLRLPFYRKVRRDGELRTYILGIPTD